ncbi:AEC family transporter [Clostridium tyrobutyricum]|uniref:AEC family transporter n=1 Tax=Clostridium tyrobutyricum TaxID=1519 RepID=UPI002B21FC58|nr:AEC family transporter [Clostridium tyrobutyricum]MEA5009238.1 AEC family transporter [Clostridium tyrobutyricum]
MYLVLENVVILFVFIFLGYFLGKKEVIHTYCTSDLSNFLVKVALPITIFCSMIRPFEQSLLVESIQIFVIMIIFHIVCLFIGLAVVKICNIKTVQAGVWIFICMFSNNGFMGFPLSQSIYGNSGLFLMAIGNVVSNFLIFSVGVKLLIRGNNTVKLSGRQLFYNNINIAVVLGLIFYFTQCNIPDVVMKILKDLGNLTAPLSMIVVGLSISKSNVKEIFKNKKIYILTFMRLLIIPFITVAVVKMLPFGSRSLIPGLLILISALPAPSSVSIIAEQYNTDTKTASQSIFMTTLFSLATIPLVMCFVK